MRSLLSFSGQMQGLATNQLGRATTHKRETPPKLSLGGVPVSNGKERLALLALFGLARGLRSLSLLFRSHSINLPRHWDD
jgi:hypothetical protein